MCYAHFYPPLNKIFVIYNYTLSNKQAEKGSRPESNLKNIPYCSSDKSLKEVEHFTQQLLEFVGHGVPLYQPVLSPVTPLQPPKFSRQLFYLYIYLYTILFVFCNYFLFLTKEARTLYPYLVQR